MAPLFWAGNTVLARIISYTESIPPCCLAFFRWTLVFFILLPFTKDQIKRDWITVKKSWKFLLLVSFLGFNPLPYLALYHTTAINGALILSAMPAVVILTCYVLYKEKISFIQTIGVLFCFLGAIIVVLKGQIFKIMHLDINKGDIFMSIETVLYGVYSAIFPKFPSIHPVSFLTLASGIASLGTLPFCFVEILVSDKLVITTTAIITILYASIFSSIIAYYFWNVGIKTVGSNKTGLFINFIPIFTFLLAIFFLGETLRNYHVIGSAAILFGILSFNYKELNPL